MNRIFKTKWCHTNQSYVVCSELAKRAGKVSGIMATTLLLSNVATATLPKTVSADETLTGTTYTETLNGSFFNINNNATATFNGNMLFDITANGDNEPHFDITNGNLTTEDKLSITIAPDTNTKHTRPKGMIIRGDSTVNIKDLAVKVTHASEEDADYGSPDSNASYGIALGYNYNGGAADKFSKLTVNNADINVTNTENTVFGNKTVSRRVFGFNVTAKVKFGHQLSGLKIYRTSGSTPEFVSNGTLNINVNDSSSAKAGDYLVGVYISGNGSKATFNGDTNITVSANGINSAGIKIGKPFEDSENGVSVTANGKLIVDTTATADSAAIRLFNNNAKLEVTGKNTQEKSEIKSGNSAIVYDTQDWKTSADVTFAGTIYTSRNSNGNNQSVKLNNTELSTTSETASLIKVNAENVRDQSAGQASRFSNQLNHGKFSVKNATFELSGDKSLATAAHNGWLMEVKGLDNTTPSDENKSDLTATISDGAKIIGSVHKEHSSVLNLSLDNATWVLKPKGTDSITSTLNKLTISNQGTLDASMPLNISDTEKAEISTALTEAKNKYEEAKNKVATLKQYSWEKEDRFEARKNRILEPAKAELEKQEKRSVDFSENIANYRIKLSSDSTVNDGTLTNAGIITMANKSYSDKLTLEGNYIAQDNATLKLNTLWNSPGNDNGANSQSDLLEIKGSASGTTNVISVSAEGTENILDGSIGSISTDLNTRTVPVIRVYDTTSTGTFTGKAKTTGAGQLSLVSKEVENPADATQKVREFYWTLTTPNDNSIVIYDPVVSGYVQMPQVNLAQGYETLRTLHTRRGENQTLAWDKIAKQQSWGRVFGSHLYAKGKTRLGFEMDTLGVQLGQDFDIRTNEQNTHYLTGVYVALTESKARFSDELRFENGIMQQDKFTGSAKAKSWSLGLTHTRYAQNGSYVDLVGQLSFFNNKYHSRDDIKAKNKGISYLLSAEVGRPYILKASEQHQAHWLIEPQAQLVYQYLDSKKFNDGLKRVTPKDVHHLRGRAGFRLAYNQPADKNNPHTKSLYLTANILHDFTSGNKVQIGQDTIREKYDQTWWDIGLGIQHPIGKKAYVYLDGHYEGNFSSNRTREGYRGSVGIKYNW